MQFHGGIELYIQEQVIDLDAGWLGKFAYQVSNLPLHSNLTSYMTQFFILEKLHLIRVITSVCHS